MKHLKLFESFEIVEPIKYGEPLNVKEINFLKGYNIMCPEWILKDDNYYYVFNHRCENIKDLPETYIHGVCKKYGITNYTINDDYTIDVDSDVIIHGISLTKIPLKFNKVSGNFYCGRNQLTTLEGSPEFVVRSFYCNDNQLTTLEGSPEYVGAHFSCQNNLLITLLGSPEFVGFDFDCYSNQLTTLEGAPESVGGDFNCTDNKLTTLKGGPIEVGKDFSCTDNKLTTLEGSPKSVGEDFFCSGNNLTTFEGKPDYIGGDFYWGGKIHKLQ
jgi:hypothetical protein